MAFLLNLTPENAERINKILSNYKVKGGRTGAINYVLRLGFKEFEKKYNTSFEKMKIKTFIDDLKNEEDKKD